jgi:hypothetical protein
MQFEGWTSPAGKRRMLTRLDPTERRRYERAVALAFPNTRPGPSVFSSPAPGRAISLAVERRRWRAALGVRAIGASSVLASDVADCFPSIGERAIRAAAAQAQGDPAPLLRVIRRYRDAGGFGIPIGPPASATVADAVLALADDRARVAGCEPIRWVDDVVFAGGRNAVARAARAWRDALIELGMREHEGKRTTGASDAHGSPVAWTGRGIMRGS